MTTLWTAYLCLELKSPASAARFPQRTGRTAARSLLLLPLTHETRDINTDYSDS